MARTPKNANNIQVFRGGFARPDVFALNANSGCCPGGVEVAYDKLPNRVRFDNGLNHLDPTGGSEKVLMPLGGPGFADFERDVINHINDVGVGATISVIAIPTYAFLTGVGVRIEASEPGLTFNLITRNGLVIPVNQYRVTAAGEECSVTRTLEVADVADPDAEPPVVGENYLAGFGALGANDAFIDIFARSALGEFSLEADELMLQVATIPAAGTPVTGAFRIEVSASYDVINRAVA